MPQAPYDQLYIYEISGDARMGATGLGPGFLGLWLEGDTSFLFFSQPADQAVQGVLAGQTGLKLNDRHHLSYEQWQGGLRLEPLRLPGLTVLPAWSRSPRPRRAWCCAWTRAWSLATACTPPPATAWNSCCCAPNKDPWARCWTWAAAPASWAWRPSSWARRGCSWPT